MERLIQDIASLQTSVGSHDFALHVQGTPWKVKVSEPPVVIPVHKVIISARSPVFTTMLKIIMKEATEGFVRIDDSTPEAIETLVSFMYSGQAKLKSAQHCVDVSCPAHKYGVDSLLTICEQYLSTAMKESGSVLQKDTFLALFDAADHLGFKSLENVCLTCAAQHRQKVIEEWDFPNFLSHEQCKKVILSDGCKNGNSVEYHARVTYSDY